MDDFWHVSQQQQEKEEEEQCQIVCTDVSTIEQDQDQPWDFAAALQDEHPGSAMLIMPASIL